MAIRYTAEALLRLRESPLCLKPNTLPPAEEWMGPPPENLRGQGNKITTDRTRHANNSLSEQTNRRPGLDRNLSRNGGNADEIVLGPPRATFSSATHLRAPRSFDGDKQPKEGDARDRFPFRGRNGEADANDRFRDRDRDRDGRVNFRRRGENDQDSDGWSTVKPRKSFGQEGAERFHGRMGERPDRYGGDRRSRDQDDRENGDRPRRNFGDFAKDKDGEDGERPRRNGLNRNRSDAPWARDNNNEPPTARERFDRAKSWRDRAPVDDQSGETNAEKPRDRGHERRWDRDRDHRQEREPEWLDEPVEEKPQKHTEEDFKKFMENMKAGRNTAAAGPTLAPAIEPSAREDKTESEKTQAMSVPAIELGPDKFFAAFGQSTAIETTGKAGEVAKENVLSTPAPKPKTASRFQNFFSSQEESRRQTEPPTPAAACPLAAEVNPLLALAGAAPPASAPKQDAAEKVAFQALLQKLQKQSLQASTPPSGGFSEPPPNDDFSRKNSVASPGQFLPFVPERREEPLIRGPVLQNQEIHAPRPQQGMHMPSIRSEQQILHELIGQRHAGPNQGPVRAEQTPSRNNNSNAEFLMTLMQSSRGIQELQRNEQPIMRMPQPSRPAQIPATPDREPDYQRERSSQVGRPTALPGFFDEPQLHHREQDSRPQQPTQILQRQQAPPGLEQMHPSSWMQAGGPQVPPPGRPMIPPPGLANNPRNAPPPGIFPPNFPVGAFPPPEGMGGPPPRNMPPPPGFFGGPGGPPPGGFMPPPGMGFQAPEALSFGFDGRNMPPPGAGGPFRRN
ncbi:hypothetical protein DL769_010315 [Monosporascus sp. CRB-8-3]|nr:hypothetical protein DL769_010315 [Monosporascus sp. CRB-8-3]